MSNKLDEAVDGLLESVRWRVLYLHEDRGSILIEKGTVRDELYSKDALIVACDQRGLEYPGEESDEFFSDEKSASCYTDENDVVVGRTEFDAYARAADILNEYYEITITASKLMAKCAKANPVLDRGESY